MLTRNLGMLASGAHIDAGLFNTHEFMQQTVLPCITHLTRRLAEPSRNPDQPIQSQVLGQCRIPSIRKRWSQARALNREMNRDCVTFDSTYRAVALMAAKSSLEMPLRALNYLLPVLEPEQLSLNSSPGVGCRDDE